MYVRPVCLSHCTALRVCCCAGSQEISIDRLLHDRHEENEWDHKISADVKVGPADCIRMAEVRAVLKKIKRHKTPLLSGLVAEMKNAADWKCVVTV